MLKTENLVLLTLTVEFISLVRQDFFIFSLVLLTRENINKNPVSLKPLNILYYLSSLKPFADRL